MKQTEKVGLLLASGFTKKEIANRLKKSPHTVNQQARVLYERTHSRNLADITRYTIGNLLKVDIDTLLRREIGRAVIFFLIAVVVLWLVDPELNTKIWNWFTSALVSLTNK
jgi:DNA-binding CsgD family transcriptional regulator